MHAPSIFATHFAKLHFFYPSCLPITKTKIQKTIVQQKNAEKLNQPTTNFFLFIKHFHCFNYGFVLNCSTICRVLCCFHPFCAQLDFCFSSLATLMRKPLTHKFLWAIIHHWKDNLWVNFKFARFSMSKSILCCRIAPNLGVEFVCEFFDCLLLPFFTEFYDLWKNIDFQERTEKTEFCSTVRV